MNKEKLMSFIKGKQFYYVLLIGFIAIFSIASLMLFNSNQEMNVAHDEVVDLNTPLEGEEEGKDVVLEPAVSDDLEEAFDTYEPPSIANEEIIGESEENLVNTIEKEEEENALVPTTSGSLEVIEGEQPPKMQETFLAFNEEMGMILPLQGDILFPYSDNKAIYFETLDQYKFFHALAIKAMVGTEVKLAANGVVESITQDEETGTTVTVDHGNGYKSIYGQLEQLTIKVGDQVEQGKVIGVVASPTIYYSKEGSHLFFKVLKDNESINPESVLKE